VYPAGTAVPVGLHTSPAAFPGHTTCVFVISGGNLTLISGQANVGALVGALEIGAVVGALDGPVLGELVGDADR
jgi:hypothetical protein